MTMTGGGVVVGLMTMVLGVVITVGSVRQSRRSKQSGAWPTVVGVVVKSRVEDDEGTYQADVTYEYEVAGCGYYGTRIRFGYCGGPRRGSAQELAAAYPVGRTVAIHYDPGGPKESVLQPGKDTETFGLVLGMFFVVAGFAGVLSG